MILVRYNEGINSINFANKNYNDLISTKINSKNDWTNNLANNNSMEFPIENLFSEGSNANNFMSKINFSINKNYSDSSDFQMTVSPSEINYNNNSSNNFACSNNNNNNKSLSSNYFAINPTNSRTYCTNISSNNFSHGINLKSSQINTNNNNLNRESNYGTYYFYYFFL